MDIRTLQYFLAIAREESITKAAGSLNMTQPPLSRQMKDLEEELGKQLFIRGSKKISLTEDGLLLKKRAEEMVALLDKTMHELTSSEESIAGDILIAAGETENISILAKIGKSLNKKYPDIHFKIYSGDSEYVKDKIDNGLVDFGLVIGTVDLEKYDYIKLPVSDRWGIIMKDTDALAKYDRISSAQLADRPLLLSHQASNNSEIMSWFQANKVVPNIITTYNLAYNASVFVKTGFGYMLALDNILNTAIGSGLVFRPITPGLKADMYVIWKKNQIFGKAASIYLDEIKNSIKTTR
ncbi:MAG: LysR family transcriptional regulator [Lachnospiraceae bacterium]|nr:LysR family transcriptional regulator [Lachnospiraceae bacterium]